MPWMRQSVSTTPAAGRAHPRGAHVLAPRDHALAGAELGQAWIVVEEPVADLQPADALLGEEAAEGDGRRLHGAVVVGGEPPVELDAVEAEGVGRVAEADAAVGFSRCSSEMPTTATGWLSGARRIATSSRPP